MMGLQRGPTSLLQRKMNMSQNWNQPAGTGTGDDGGQDDSRINSRREGHQGGSPTDPLLNTERFHPLQETQQGSNDDDSPIDSYAESTLQASPFAQQQSFASSGGGLQAPGAAYSSPTALFPSHERERKRPPPGQLHPGQPMLPHPGQPKEADDHQNESAAAGLDSKPPGNNDDPFVSPHLSVAGSFEEQETPAASAKRARVMDNTAGYSYHPTGTPHQAHAAALPQAPPGGPPYYGGGGDHHHRHPWAGDASGGIPRPEDFSQYHAPPAFMHYSPPPAPVYRFGGEQHPQGLGMHPPPPPPMPTGPPPLMHQSPAHAQQLQQQPQQQGSTQDTMNQPPILPRRNSNNRPLRAAAAAAVHAPPPPPPPLPPRPQMHRARTAGETTVQAMHPTAEEMAECATPRARQALETWYQRLTELYRFKMQKGHCRVPQQYPENRQLGVWVNKQRMEKKNHEKNMRTSLTATKIANLDRMGFEWGKRKGDEAWQSRYSELVDYKNTHGNCDVPTKYTANPALGRWVSTQRSQYKHYPNKHMTQERVNLLNHLGFRWSMMDPEEHEEQQLQQANEETTNQQNV